MADFICRKCGMHCPDSVASLSPDFRDVCLSCILDTLCENKASEFKEGEYIIYQNGDSFEIGKIKRLTDDGAFVYYHDGDTAALTPFDCMHKIVNAYTIKNTSLGSEDKE